MAGFSRPPRAQLLSYAGQVERSSRTPRERREVWVQLEETSFLEGSICPGVQPACRMRTQQPGFQDTDKKGKQVQGM